jgi:hypothetical protein
LIHGERTDWMPRVRMILQSGDTETFVPFDRRGHVREIEGKLLPQLLDEFERLRAANLDELRALHLHLRPGRGDGRSVSAILEF